MGGRLPELHRRHRRDLAGLLEHLHTRDTSSRCLPRAAREARALEDAAGLGPPLVLLATAATSTTTSSVTIDESVAPGEYNYRDQGRARAADWARREQPFEMPGPSCFLRVDDRVFHTYSLYAPRRRVDRRLVLLPRPHRARPPGGLGGAEGPRRRRARRAARLRELAGRAGDRGPGGACAPGAQDPHPRAIDVVAQSRSSSRGRAAPTSRTGAKTPRRDCAPIRTVADAPGARVGTTQAPPPRTVTHSPPRDAQRRARSGATLAQDGAGAHGRARQRAGFRIRHPEPGLRSRPQPPARAGAYASRGRGSPPPPARAPSQGRPARAGRGIGRAGVAPCGR